MLGWFIEDFHIVATYDLCLLHSFWIFPPLSLEKTVKEATNMMFSIKVNELNGDKNKYHRFLSKSFDFESTLHTIKTTQSIFFHLFPKKWSFTEKQVMDLSTLYSFSLDSKAKLVVNWTKEYRISWLVRMHNV